MVNEFIAKTVMIKKSDSQGLHLQVLLDCAETLNNEISISDVEKYLSENGVAYKGWSQLYMISYYLRDKLGLPQPEGEF